MLCSDETSEWEFGLDDVFLMVSHSLELSQSNWIQWRCNNFTLIIYILYILGRAEISGCGGSALRAAKPVWHGLKVTWFQGCHMFEDHAIKSVIRCFRNFFNPRAGWDQRGRREWLYHGKLTDRWHSNRQNSVKQVSSKGNHHPKGMFVHLRC